VVTTPNRWSSLEAAARLLTFRPIAAMARAVYREPVDALGHINLLSRRQLMRQLHAAGFKVHAATDLALYLPLLAEFGGQLSCRLARGLAGRLAHTRLRGLLWTQCLVVQKTHN
jgi:hypothetical protein